MSSKPWAVQSGVSCLADGGMMGALMRTHDWQATPIGGVEHWPQSLCTVLSLLLASTHPMYVAWGPKFTQFYNDAYCPILGSARHPAALGQGAPECFRESWDVLGPVFQRALEPDGAAALIDQMLPIGRNGLTEECYFTFCYSPVRQESGSTGGVLVTVCETTRAVRAERRLLELSSEGEHLDAQLRRTQKLESLGVLAGGVAHDFNNLLVGILGNASLVMDGVPALHPNRVMLEDLMKAAERAADLTRPPLAYPGKGRFVLRTVDLSSLV